MVDYSKWKDIEVSADCGVDVFQECFKTIFYLCS